MNISSFFTLKRILLAVAILVLLGCIGFFGILFIKHQHKVTRYNDAMKAYDSGDFENAKKLLRNCLYDQFNSEEVYVKLALIAEHEENWHRAATYWQHTAALNPFKPEYAEAQFKALKMSRNFPAIANTLEHQKTKGQLSQEQMIILAYAYYMEGKEEQAKETFELVTDQAEKEKPLAQILTLYLIDTQRTIREALDILQQFHNDKDKFTAFEALYGSANRYARVNDTKKGKECMERIAQLNPFVGKPLLGDYLYTTGLISEAIPVLEECTQENPPMYLAAILGECYTITNQPDKLKNLFEQFKTGSMQRITTGYYLEALHAYLTHDDKTLIDSLSKCEENFMSPIAMLVKLYAAIHADNLNHVSELLQQIMGNRVYANYQQAATKMSRQFISDLVKQNQPERAAVIARLLFNNHNQDLLLARLVIGSQVSDGSITQSDIDNILKTYPNDPILLNFITKYYLKKGNYQAALNSAQTNIATNHNANVDMNSARIQLLQAQEAMGQLDEAKKTATEILQHGEGNLGANIIYVDFCSKQKDITALKTYASTDQPSDSNDIIALKIFALAQVAYMENKKDDVPAILDNIKDAQSAVLFKVAFLYSALQKYEKANETYQKIIDKGDNTIMITLNMSENYAALGQKNKALEYAKMALDKASDSPTVREIYALRLCDLDRLEEAFPILDSLVSAHTIMERGIHVWLILMEGKLQKLANEKNWHECIAECKRVLIVSPDNEKTKTLLATAELELKAANAVEEEKQKAETHPQ